MVIVILAMPLKGISCEVTAYMALRRRTTPQKDLRVMICAKTRERLGPYVTVSIALFANASGGPHS